MNVQRIVVAASIAVLLAGAVSIDPGHRDDLAAQDAVTAFAMADNGLVVAGTADQGGRVPWGDGTIRDVWYVWDATGALQRVDDADPPGCPSPGTTSTEACKSHVVAIDVAKDGRRAVVAANDDDEDSARIIRVDTLTGPQGTVQLPSAQVTAVAMSPNGERFAVALAPSELTDDPRIVSYAWSGAEAWNVTLGDPVTQMAIKNDGTVAAINGHAITINPFGEATTRDILGDAVSMAQAGEWMFAGGDRGHTYAFFGNETAARWNIKPTSQAMTDLAATPDGAKLITADAGGVLRVYDNGVTATLRGQTPAHAGAKDLHFASDAKTFAFAAGQEIHFYATQGPTLWWTADAGDDITGLRASHDLAHIAAAVGADVKVYGAVDGFQVDVDTRRVDAAPGDKVTREVTVTNTGNRFDTLTLSASGPWTTTLDKTEFALAPGAQGKANLTWTVPAGTQAGDYQVRLTGGAAEEIPVRVAAVAGWRLTAPATAKGVDQGDSVDFEVRIQNTGNAPGVIDLSTSIDRAAWTASIAPARFDLQPGGQATATVTITAPDDAPDDETATATVRAGGESVQLKSTIGAVYGVQVSATPPSTIPPGGSGDMQVRIQNTGNTQDTYTLRVQAPAGWLVEGTADYPGSTTLQGGEQDLITFTIQVPNDAGPGANVLRVTAQSLLDPDRTSTVGAAVRVADNPEPEEPTPLPVGLAMIAAAAAASAMRRRRDLE